MALLKIGFTKGFIIIKFRSNINDGVKKYLKIQDAPHSTPAATGLI
jgi:hypothetical protein